MELFDNIDFYITENGQLPAVRVVSKFVTHRPYINEEVILSGTLYRVTNVIHLESGGVQCYVVNSTGDIDDG